MNGYLRPLFGGSINTFIPENYVDASDFRTVPDNQEVFVSEADDSSITFDILERIDEPDNEVAQFHFDALGIDNEVDEEDTDASRTFAVSRLAPELHPKLSNVPCYSLTGYQKIVKGHYRSSAVSNVASTHANGSSQVTYVVIFLVIFRLENVDTDLVITSNYPLYRQDELEAIHQDDATVLSWMSRHPGLSRAELAMKAIVQNFEIVDWGLFDVAEDEDDA